MSLQGGRRSLGFSVAGHSRWPSGLPGWGGGAFLVPYLGVVPNLREAVDFSLVVRVQCVFGGCVLMEKAVL